MNFRQYIQRYLRLFLIRQLFHGFTGYFQAHNSLSLQSLLCFAFSSRTFRIKLTKPKIIKHLHAAFDSKVSHWVLFPLRGGEGGLQGRRTGIFTNFCYFQILLQPDKFVKNISRFMVKTNFQFFSSFFFLPQKLKLNVKFREREREKKN